MDQRRLSPADITIGEPLPWDVYGEGKQLLLRRGQVVQTIHQMEELVKRGLFVNAAQMAEAARARKEAQEARKETPSALRFVNLGTRRLERLLYNLPNESDAGDKFLEVVKALSYAFDINADIALSCLHLNHAIAGYAIRHCIDTALLALAVARAMNLPPDDIRPMLAAALTMNLGMLRQQDQLQAKSEPLSEKERELIHGHPHESAALLEQAGISDSAWLACVRLHHENADGSGYPLGAQVTGIPQNCRILAMADRYCAAVTPRQYRKALAVSPAIRDVFMPGGRAADPLLAAYFIKVLTPYPPGSHVRLQCGEIGVVTRRGTLPNEPVVHALLGPRGAPLSFPIQRDTSKDLYKVREAVPAELAPLRFSMQQLWGEEAAL